MRYLITGGAGFIGSHLADRLLAARNVSVTLLDDFSTGRRENIAHLEGRPDARLVTGSVLNERLLEEAVRESDAVFHLASAVGVKLVIEKPVRSIETIVEGTGAVLRQAARHHRPVLITSTSEVYGKSHALPFREDGDQVMGATDNQRWAYASAKAVGEFLALAYYRETRLPVVVVRLFNVAGPRQTWKHGMVMPTLVRQALLGWPLTVHGDGRQARCFCHVSDAVRGLAGLMRRRKARGEVVNIGAPHEITIGQLARRVKKLTGSRSSIRFVPHEEAYQDGFEELARRVPCLEKARRLIGYRPRKGLDECILDTAAWVARELGL
jgi:UDP-glucose 4-epimerase